MRRDNKAEIQHYVPKVLLRRFAFGKAKKEKIHVFDKLTDQEFSPSLSGIVAERSYNDLHLDDGMVSLEPSFTTLEQHAGEAIARLIEEECLSALSEEQRAWLAIFVAAQHLRVRQFREDARHLDDALRAKVEALGHSIDEVQGYEFFEDSEDIKRFSLEFFAENIRAYAAMVLEKRWYLIKSAPEHPLLLSDSPVILHNDADYSPYGNLGFMVRGIQIYMPLSPHLCLAMWCPNLAEQIVGAAKDAQAAVQEFRVRLSLGAAEDRASLKDALAQVESAFIRADAIVQAIETGVPYHCTADTHLFLNSCQIRWAQRYVLGARSEFALARRMMKEKPHLRIGRGLSFG